MHSKTTYEDMPDLIAKVNLRLVPISAYGNITLCYKHNTLVIWSNFNPSIISKITCSAAATTRASTCT